MEEPNKENMAENTSSTSSSMISSFLGRRPLHAIASYEKQANPASLIKPSLLHFEFSKPVKVLLKSESAHAHRSKREKEQKLERKEQDEKRPRCEKSELDKSKSVPQSQIQSAPRVQLPLPPWKTKVKEEEIPIPDWLLFYSPYLEESITIHVDQEKEDVVPNKPINSSRGMRMILVDWLAMLQSFLHLDDDVYQLSARIFDMVLSQHDLMTEELQLAALTAFWIANKAITRYEISAMKLVILSKNSYTVKQLCNMEKSLLKLLNWHIPLDTPLSICAYQAKLIGLFEHKTLRDTTSMLLDVSLLSWDLSWLPHSKLASAATYCALKLLSLSQETEWEKLALKEPSCHKLSTIRDIICAQLQLLSDLQSPTTKFNGIKEKYKKFHYSNVGTLITEAKIKEASRYFLAIKKD